MPDPLRLAVSNIAWEPVEDAAVAELLRSEGVGGVEIAPTTWCPHPADAAAEEIAAYRRSWNDRGLAIVSLQSLLFGRPDLQLFGDDSSRAALADYMRRIIDLGAALGAGVLVFGSPKNRRRGSLSTHRAFGIAVDFFRDVGAFAHARRVCVCIEANPPEYGCDFITTTAEAVALCRAVDHPGIRVNGDLGGMTMAREDIPAALASAAPFVAHFHASESNLAELGASANHICAARGLAAIAYNGWVSIEMRSCGSGQNALAVERAVRLAKRAYAPFVPLS
jgi:D-psicose/D-tagatose/L-ribulose 3-epimerase